MSVRTLGVLAAVLVVLAGVWWFTANQPPTTPVVEVKGKDAMLFRVPNDDLTDITLMFQGRTMAMKKQDGQWNVTIDGATLPGDQARISSSSLALGAVVAERIIAENPESYSQYGLQPPRASIQVAGGGRSGGVEIGETNPVGRVDYARIPGQPAVYLISPSWGQVVAQLFADLPLPKASPTPGPSPTPSPTPTPQPRPTITLPTPAPTAPSK